eukprot:8025270-Pyramimonas_sp.AAC.1
MGEQEARTILGMWPRKPRASTRSASRGEVMPNTGIWIWFNLVQVGRRRAQRGSETGRAFSQGSGGPGSSERLPEPSPKAQNTSRKASSASLPPLPRRRNWRF